MRVLFTVILAGLVSAAAGVAVALFASRALPRFDDAASVGMGEVFGILGSLSYAVLAMIVFGLTLWRARTERAIKFVMIALVTPPLLVLLFGMSGGGGGLARELQGVLQFIVPLCLVAVVQWLVLRTFVLRRAG